MAKQQLIWASLILGGCVPGATSTHSCDLSVDHLLVFTTDYSSGTLAAIGEDDCVADELTALPGDSILRALGDTVAVASRGTSDVVRLFDRGQYAMPVAEFVPARGANVQDLVRVNDSLFVSMYNQNQIFELSLEGEKLGELDLSDFADSDGYGEIGSMLITEGRLWVAVQRLNRGEALWTSSAPGVVVVFSTTTLERIAELEVGVNPVISEGRQGKIWVRTGLSYEDDDVLYELDPADYSLVVVPTPLSGDLTLARDELLVSSDFDPKSRKTQGFCGEEFTTKGWWTDAVVTEQSYFATVRTDILVGEPAVVVLDRGCTQTHQYTGFALEPMEIESVSFNVP